PDIEPVEDTKDDQRDDALSRRGHVVDPAEAVFEDERLTEARAIRGQIPGPDRAADGLKLFRHAGRELAAIKAVQTVCRERTQRASETFQPELAARLRNGSLQKECFRKAGDRFQ